MEERSDAAALAGGLRLTHFPTLVEVAVEHAYDDLQKLANSLPGQRDEDRKRELLQHLNSTRQRLLKLFVLAQWANKAPAVIECGRVLDVASGHAAACRDSADQLAYLHGEAELLRAPAYDVHTAQDVLQSGGYNLLPECIADLRPPAVPPAPQRRAAVRHMDQLLRSKLLQEKLPGKLMVRRIANGIVTLRHGDEYEARLTLAPAPEVVVPPSVPSETVPPERGASGEVRSDQAMPSADPRQATAPAGGELHPPEAAATGASVPSARQVSNGQATGTGLQGAAPMDLDTVPQGEPRPPDPGGVEGAPGDPGSGLATDEGLADREAPGAGVPQGTQDRPDPDKWRWRPLSMTVLPGFTGETLIFPEQAIQLQRQVEIKMWLAADALALRAKLGTVASEGNTAQLPGPAAIEKSAGNLPTPSQASGATRPADEANAEDNLAQPLEVMHGVLYQVACRLLLSRVTKWAVQQEKDKSAFWHGTIRRHVAQHLASGVRITYWHKERDTAVPWLTPETLEAFLGGTLPSEPLVDPPNPRSPPPAVEIGFDAEGFLAVQHFPPLPVLDPASGPVPGRFLTFQLSSRTADLEDVLVKATAANAALQLVGLKRVLDKAAEVLQYSGTSKLLVPERLEAVRRGLETKAGGSGGMAERDEDPPTAGSPGRDREDSAAAGRTASHTPFLELRLPGGEVVLTVRVQLPSGRLSLNAGDAADSSNPRLLKKLDEKQNEALVVPKVPPGGPAVLAVTQMGSSVALTFAALAHRLMAAKLTSTARKFNLNQLGVPPSLVKAYLDRTPFLVARPPERGVHYVFSISSEAGGAGGFPHQQSNAFKRCRGAAGSKEVGVWAGAAGVRFHLMADLHVGRESGSSGWSYFLASLSCDSVGMPLQMLDCEPISLGPEKDSNASNNPSRADSKPENASSGKRKREDTEEPGCEVSGPEGEAGRHTRIRQRTADCLSRDLGAVVGACWPRINWQLLRLQAQALRLPFEEVCWLEEGRPTALPDKAEPSRDLPLNGACDTAQHFEDAACEGPAPPASLSFSQVFTAYAMWRSGGKSPGRGNGSLVINLPIQVVLLDGKAQEGRGRALWRYPLQGTRGDWGPQGTRRTLTGRSLRDTGRPWSTAATLRVSLAVVVGVLLWQKCRERTRTCASAHRGSTCRTALHEGMGCYQLLQTSLGFPGCTCSCRGLSR
eukprot:jgi/Botrbrau1/17653/Bobra.0166s0081.1